MNAVLTILAITVYVIFSGLNYNHINKDLGEMEFNEVMQCFLPVIHIVYWIDWKING